MWAFETEAADGADDDAVIVMTMTKAANVWGGCSDLGIAETSSPLDLHLH